MFLVLLYEHKETLHLYMNKDGVVKRIKFEKINEYIQDGWRLGIKPK